MQCLRSGPVGSLASSSSRAVAGIAAPLSCRCSRSRALAQHSAAAAAGQQVRQTAAAAAAAGRQRSVTCQALNTPGGPGPNKGAADIGFKFNPIYLGIIGAYTALLLFRNPYLYAVLTVATVLPQNSNVTSLNNLVLLFYESGLFMNFAEAVTCVRLVTWLSMGYMIAAFALFS